MIEQALANEEKSVVTPDELTVLASRRRRWSAVRAARKRWGRKVASELRQLHKEQLKLVRMIAGGGEQLASQRSHIVAVRRTYDASSKAARAIEGRSVSRSSFGQRARDERRRRDYQSPQY